MQLPAKRVVVADAAVLSLPRRLMMQRGRRAGRLAREEIDVEVTSDGTSQDGLVRVERRRRDGGAPALLKEAGVGLELGQPMTVKVEHLHAARGGAPVQDR